MLYAGRAMELSSRAALATPPRHPYTALLLASVPELRPGWIDEVGGSVAARTDAGTAQRPDTGCPFAPRCALRVTPQCEDVAPPLRTTTSGKRLLCHRSEAELAALATPPGPG